MGSLRIGVTRRELKFVADMLDCSAGFVKPGSFNVRMHVRSVQSVVALSHRAVLSQERVRC